MNCSLYLINPAPDFPSYFNTDVLKDTVKQPVTHAVGLALPTVAAMVPDDIDITLCDEELTPVDFDTPARFVGITGMVSQWRRMQEIAVEFRNRGKIVLIGGPHASLCHQAVRPFCDILVRGEIEEIAAELFDDLKRGEWKTEYIGTTPDLSRSPVPRLDLYPNERSLSGAVQTSRGCPFQCEFCDVIQYQGRKQRFKTIPQVLTELDQLHSAGYRHVFITDDNLTANRKRAKQLLSAIRDWNERKKGRLSFATQVSIDVAEDDELLQLCVDAGIQKVFIGIETPNEDSLREAGKRQNLKRSIVRQVERFIESGIVVLGGMIVGFDSDGPDIFKRQYEFAMSLPVPVFTAGALFAPETTPLYARLHREGRIRYGGTDFSCQPWNTNIIPRQMTRGELTVGLKWLCNNLYSPRAFEKRVRRLVDMLGKTAQVRRPSRPSQREPLRRVEKECLVVLKKLPLLGLAEAGLTLRMIGLILRKPRAAATIIYHLFFYLQIRHLFKRGQFWAPSLASREQPSRVPLGVSTTKRRVTGPAEPAEALRNAA